MYILKSSKDLTAIRYVGITKHETSNQRLAAHLRSARSGSRYPVHQWITKHVADGHEIVAVTVDSGLTWEEAYQLEQEMISDLRDKGCMLLNKTDGGLGTLGRKASDETRRKQSEAAKKRPPREQSEAERAKRREIMLNFRHTEETKKKLSEINKGRPGHKHTPETIEKIRAKQRGVKRKPLTEEHKAKLSEASKRLRHTPETKAKMSQSQKGRVFSEETRRKMSESAKRRRRT